MEGDEDSSSVSMKMWGEELALLPNPGDGLLKQIAGEKEKRCNNWREWGTSLSLYTSPGDEKRKRSDEDDDEIPEFEKMSLGTQYGLPREIFEQITSKRPPSGLLDEVEVPSPEADNKVVERFVPKKRRTTPEEANENMVYGQESDTQKTFSTFQGSSSTSPQIEKVDEHCLVLYDHHRKLKRDRRQYNNDKLKKQIPKKKKRVVQPAQPAPQLIPERIKEEILNKYGGGDIMWVSEKLITDSDRRKSQNRLFLPSDCFELLENIMTDEEKNKSDVSKDEKGSNIPIKKKTGLKIKLLDHNLKAWDMDFKYWPSLAQKVFTGNWFKLVEKLVLVAGDKVQIWCFRVPAQNMKLYFAINVEKTGAQVPAPGAEAEAADVL